MRYIKKLRIGNVELENNLILAPMAGVTNRPFRMICKEYGAGMVCTEMASARAMFHNDVKTKKLATSPDSNIRYFFIMKILLLNGESLSYAYTH